MLPVTGPYSTVKSIPGRPNSYGFTPTWGWIERTWYRQRKPYGIELPYSYYKSMVISHSGGDNTSYVEYYDREIYPPSNDAQRLYNAAYAKYADSLNEVKATLGATLGEWKSSSSMIATRASQLWRGFKAAKRGDLSGLKRAWGRHAGIRSRSRAAGNHVLEYSFGWAPLVKDINSALEVLHKRLPPHRVKVRKSYSGKVSSRRSLGSFSRNATVNYTIGWALRARVGVNNPNTLLAAQLGLVNLGSVLWELTPNSYIIDYFFNVGEFIDSFTAEVGLDVTDKWKTSFRKNLYSVSDQWNYPFDRAPDYPGYPPNSWAIEEVTVTRSSGIPGPTVALRLPWRMSMQRASTSIARLLQQLKGK